MLEDSLRGIKEAADLAEEYAVDEQKAVDRTIQQAEHARITAEKLRKTAEDTAKARREISFSGIYTSDQIALEDSLRVMKEAADLAEEYAIDKQKAVGCAIQQAEHARITAEKLRKPAEDTGKAIRETSFSGIYTSHQIALEDSLRGMKETAELAEEYAVDKQKGVDRAIQQAEHARIAAEKLRKTAEDTAKARREISFSGIYTSHQIALEDSLRGMKETAELAEEYAVDKQKGVDRAIQQAEHARITAEKLRKTAEDTAKARREISFSGIYTSHQIALEDSLRGMKQTAELAEEYAVDKQKGVDRAIQQAEHARITAEKLRKTAEDLAKARKEISFSGFYTSHQIALEDCLRGMKEAADLAEEYAIDKQKAVGCAIQQAEHARITAEKLRKTAEDTEKAYPFTCVV